MSVSTVWLWPMMNLLHITTCAPNNWQAISNPQLRVVCSILALQPRPHNPIALCNAFCAHNTMCLCAQATSSPTLAAFADPAFQLAIQQSQITVLAAYVRKGAAITRDPRPERKDLWCRSAVKSALGDASLTSRWITAQFLIPLTARSCAPPLWLRIRCGWCGHDHA